MHWILNNLETIILIIGQICAFLIAITSLIKVFKSETRTKKEVGALQNAVTVTRAGIVQAFKDSVVTKDIKVSINKQVEKLLTEGLETISKQIAKNEERRTKMTYWTLKILKWTAASNKLTTEQQAEIDELMALIAEEEQIVDTI